MKTFLAVLAIVFCVFSAQAYALNIFKTDTVFTEAYDNSSMPTDIAFANKDGSFYIYDAMKGTITSYKNYKKGKSTSSKSFLGGNCLKLIDNSFYLCKAKDGIDILNDDFKKTTEIVSKKSVLTDLVKYGSNLFIVDRSNHRLLVADAKKDNITKTVGERGTSLGYFNYPFSIINDKDGFLYVTDVLNTRVQMVTPEMKSTLSIGGWGLNPGQMYRPKGLAMYSNKYIFVSDGYLGVIQVFDLNGKFQGVLGDKNGNIKRYQSPTRIRINGKYLAILDPYARVTEIINIGGIK